MDPLHMHLDSLGMVPRAPVSVGPGSAGAETSRAGLLIIRVWIAVAAAAPLRAEIRASTDVSAGFGAMRTLVRPEAVEATVHEWLAGMLGDVDPST